MLGAYGQVICILLLALAATTSVEPILVYIAVFIGVLSLLKSVVAILTAFGERTARNS